LSLNTTTGIISGTPTTAQSNTSYTLTASNSGGSTSVVISISIIVIPPSNLSYGTTTLNLIKDVTMTAITPTASGSPVSSYSVSPSLPAGLNLNSTSGVINGTPTTVQSNITYTITATNSAGSTTINLSIGVFSVYVSMPTGLLKTGQTTSYVTGDDGTYQKGVARNFVSGGSTGLLWQRCSAGQNNDATCSGTAHGYTWDQANSYCNSLTLAGKTWRLPSFIELQLLGENKTTQPSIDTGLFPNSQIAFYWSSTFDAIDNSRGRFVDNSNLLSFNLAKSNSLQVRCVSGSSSSLLSFTDNGDSTITQTSTGLLWQKCTAGQTSNTCSGTATTYLWSNAVSYCENLSLGNRTDWRMPNKNELLSIIDYTKNSIPRINLTYFPNSQNTLYFTSTTFVLESGDRIYWSSLDTGDFGVGYKASGNAYIRCVAGP
jgi:hypothetical protein